MVSMPLLVAALETAVAVNTQQRGCFTPGRFDSQTAVAAAP
jgi:hypothetical protein